jgi:hypothetical protein
MKGFMKQHPLANHTKAEISSLAKETSITHTFIEFYGNIEWRVLLLHKKVLGKSVKLCQVRKDNLSVCWDNFSHWEQHSLSASVETLKQSYMHISALFVHGEPCIFVPSK